MNRRIILFDLETAPILGYAWQLYETDILSVVRPSHLLCFSWKVLGERVVHASSLPDFPLYRRQPFNDAKLVQELWTVLNSADIVVAHNANKFDVKKANAYFIRHNLPPPAPYFVVDTLAESRKIFKFDSHKLDAIGDLLGIGRKEKVSWHEWEGCLNGDTRAWKRMVHYNQQDVRLLEKAYLLLRPWMKAHPSMARIGIACPKCGSARAQSRGSVTNRAGTMEYLRYACQTCHSWFRLRKGESTGVDIVST